MQKADNSKLWTGTGNRNSHGALVGMWEGTVTYHDSSGFL